MSTRDTCPADSSLVRRRQHLFVVVWCVKVLVREVRKHWIKNVNNYLFYRNLGKSNVTCSHCLKFCFYFHSHTQGRSSLNKNMSELMGVQVSGGASSALDPEQITRITTTPFYYWIWNDKNKTQELCQINFGQTMTSKPVYLWRTSEDGGTGVSWKERKCCSWGYCSVWDNSGYASQCSAEKLLTKWKWLTKWIHAQCVSFWTTDCLVFTLSISLTSPQTFSLWKASSFL